MGNLEIDLSASMRDLRQGLVLKPPLLTYWAGSDSLSWPEMPSRAFGEREHDGLFHPSTHPLWPERALYQYLVDHEGLVKRERGASEVLALVVGTAVGIFVQESLLDAGLARREDQVCRVCPPEADCHEAGFLDEETGERTHVDGILSLPGRRPGEDLFEMKTSSKQTAYQLQDLDNDGFRELWPEYWAQAQSCLRLSGRSRTVLLVMGVFYPFPMREFHIEADPEYQESLRQKYLRVRQAAADQRSPRCLCGGNARTCPSRRACL